MEKKRDLEQWSRNKLIYVKLHFYIQIVPITLVYINKIQFSETVLL